MARRNNKETTNSNYRKKIKFRLKMISFLIIYNNNND